MSEPALQGMDPNVDQHPVCGHDAGHSQGIVQAAAAGRPALSGARAGAAARREIVARCFVKDH